QVLDADTPSDACVELGPGDPRTRVGATELSLGPVDDLPKGEFVSSPDLAGEASNDEVGEVLESDYQANRTLPLPTWVLPLRVEVRLVVPPTGLASLLQAPT